MENHGRIYPQFRVKYTSYTTGMHIHWELLWGSLSYTLCDVLMSKHGSAFRTLIPFVGCILRLMELPLLHHRVALCKLTDTW